MHDIDHPRRSHRLASRAIDRKAAPAVGEFTVYDIFVPPQPYLRPIVNETSRIRSGNETANFMSMSPCASLPVILSDKPGTHDVVARPIIRRHHKAHWSVTASNRKRRRHSLRAPIVHVVRLKVSKARRIFTAHCSPLSATSMADGRKACLRRGLDGRSTGGLQ